MVIGQRVAKEDADEGASQDDRERDQGHGDRTHDSGLWLHSILDMDLIRNGCPDLAIARASERPYCCFAAGLPAEQRRCAARLLNDGPSEIWPASLDRNMRLTTLLFFA